MSKFFVIIIFSLSNFAYSQNLIPNASFEDTLFCPTGTDNSQALVGWFNPTSASPDYYHECNNGGAGVPSNDWGYQNAKNGIAYIGLSTYWNDPLLTNYREYLEIELSAPLQNGTKYYWCMWVSLLDSIEYASNNIGISLSDTTITNPSSQYFLNVNVYGNNQSIITDNLNWVEIGGSFIAEGGELFLVIGNFFSDAQTLVTQIQQNNTGGPGAYYYLDNLYLGESQCFSGEIYIPNVFTPNGDGINDFFKMENAWGNTEMYIFNRWGEIINYLEGNNCNWDGFTSVGVKCPDGVYYYLIKVEDKEFKGFIQVMR